MTGFIGMPTMQDIERLERKLAITTWLLAELTWKFNHHHHD